MDAAIWGLIGTLVGALASIATTWISSRHSLHIQEQAKSLERIEQGRAFQRQNFLELQDVMHDAMRMVTRAHLEDESWFKKNGEWGRTFLSEEVNEGLRLTGRKVSLLIERVADDALRSDLKAAAEASTKVLLATSQREAEAAYGNASALVQYAMEHIGRVLRSVY